MATVATRLRLKARNQEEAPQGDSSSSKSHSSIRLNKQNKTPTDLSGASPHDASSSYCAELLARYPMIQALPRVSRIPQLLVGLKSLRNAAQSNTPTPGQQKLFRFKPEFGKITPRDTFLDNSVSCFSHEFDIEEKNTTNFGNEKEESQAISELNLPSIARSDSNQSAPRQSEEDFLIPVVDTCESRPEVHIPPSQSAPLRPPSSDKPPCDELLHKHIQKPLSIEEQTFRKLMAPLSREGAARPILRSSGRFSIRNIGNQRPEHSRFGDSGQSIPYTMETDGSQKRVHFAKNKIIKIFKRYDAEAEL